MKEILYIQKGEKSRLPKKYRPINNLSAVIYDQLTEIFKSEHYKNLVQTNISTADIPDADIQLKDNKSHILDWLSENGLNQGLTDVVIKHVTLSVVSDLVNFMYESMSCAKKGKFIVAYALLRKPLTDELLILEQILHDKDDFINRFYHKKDVLDYDPSSLKLDKRKIISNAFRALETKWFYSEDLIYQLRYDKAFAAGLNGISNHALHIVTQDKNYRTSPQNLNFVFSAKDDFARYLDHYYFAVPYLLLYTVAIVDEIIFKFLPGEDFQNLKAVKSFRRFVGYLLWTEMTTSQEKKKNDSFIKSLREVLSFKCLRCGQVNQLLRPDYKLFFETELILCKNCYQNILISKESVKPIIDFIKLFK